MYSFNYGKILSRAEASGWFQPRPNEFLEIWVYDKLRTPIIKRGTLDQNNVHQWLAEKPMDSALGGLRLIICCSHMEANDAGKSLPFLRRTFEAIVEGFHLPLAYLQAVVDGSAYFAKFEMRDAVNGKKHLGFVLKTMWASGMNFALALSHDTQTGVTSGVLDGCLQPELAVVIERIGAAKSHACHPLLVPAVLYELVTERNVQRTKASDHEMNQIELDTGEHIYKSRVQPDLQSIDSGGSMTARVNGTATTSTFTAANIESTTLGLRAILNNISTVPLLENGPLQLQLREDGLAVRESIEYCLAICSNLRLEAEQIQSRAKTQISAIYSLIAQRDSVLNLQVANGSNRLADEARKDSSAMKTIAVLTILFLPGTFVAAFFAMPLFDWNALESRAIIQPRFYVYWLVTIPCTFLVIVVWMIWIRINNNVGLSRTKNREKCSKDKSSTDRSFKAKSFVSRWREQLAPNRHQQGTVVEVGIDEESNSAEQVGDPRNISHKNTFATQRSG